MRPSSPHHGHVRPPARAIGPGGHPRPQLAAAWSPGQLLAPLIVWAGEFGSTETTLRGPPSRGDTGRRSWRRGLACVRVVSQGALCKPSRPPLPPPAPPRGLSPRMVTKARPPPPGAIKHWTAARLPGSSRARTRWPGLHVAPAGESPRYPGGLRDGVGQHGAASGPVLLPCGHPGACPAGRTPERDGVGVGARATGSAGRRQR